VSVCCVEETFSQFVSEFVVLAVGRCMLAFGDEAAIDVIKRLGAHATIFPLLLAWSMSKGR